MKPKKYLVSRTNGFPDKTKLEQDIVYNLWKTDYAKKKFVFKNLKIGDILYWYNTKKRKIVWKTKVMSIIKVEYSSKKELKNIFKNLSYPKYYDKGPTKGIFFGCKVKLLGEAINHFVRPDFIMQGSGWEDKFPLIEKQLNYKSG